MFEKLLGYTFLYDHGSLLDSRIEINNYNLTVYSTLSAAYNALRLRFVNMPKGQLKLVDNVKKLIEEHENEEFDILVIGTLGSNEFGERRVVIKSVYEQSHDVEDAYKEYLDSDDEEYKV